VILFAKGVTDVQQEVLAYVKQVVKLLLKLIHVQTVKLDVLVLVKQDVQAVFVVVVLVVTAVLDVQVVLLV
jgi:hypothetical protein